MATLIITEGPAEGQQFALANHRIVLVGRDEKCTFQIIDQEMSRRHMQIKQIGDTAAHAVVDFSSTNGVMLNGQRIDGEAPLADGDEIRLGATAMVYSTVDSPDAATIDSVMRRRGQGWMSTIVGDAGGPPDGDS